MGILLHRLRRIVGVRKVTLGTRRSVSSRRIGHGEGGMVEALIDDSHGIKGKRLESVVVSNVSVTRSEDEAVSFYFDDGSVVELHGKELTLTARYNIGGGYPTEQMLVRSPGVEVAGSAVQVIERDSDFEATVTIGRELFVGSVTPTLNDERFNHVVIEANTPGEVEAGPPEAHVSISVIAKDRIARMIVAAKNQDPICYIK